MFLTFLIYLYAWFTGYGMLTTYNQQLLPEPVSSDDECEYEYACADYDDGDV